MNSVSPSESHGGLSPQSPSDDSHYALEVGSRAWQTSACQGQPQLEPGHDSESVNPAAGAQVGRQKQGSLLRQRFDLYRPNCARCDGSGNGISNRDVPLQPYQLPLAGLDPAVRPQPAPYNTDLTVFNLNRGIPDTLLLNDFSPSPPPEDWMPSPLQIARGCDLFFAHISPFVPFLHQPTFDASEAPPHLVISMLSLAYQYAEDPEYGDQEKSGANLSLCCFHRAQALIAADEGRADTLSHNVPSFNLICYSKSVPLCIIVAIPRLTDYGCTPA